MFGSHTAPIIASNDSMLDNLRNLGLLDLGDYGAQSGLANIVAGANGVFEVVCEGIFEGHRKRGLYSGRRLRGGCGKS